MFRLQHNFVSALHIVPMKTTIPAFYRHIVKFPKNVRKIYQSTRSSWARRDHLDTIQNTHLSKNVEWFLHVCVFRRRKTQNKQYQIFFIMRVSFVPKLGPPRHDFCDLAELTQSIDLFRISERKFCGWGMILPSRLEVSALKRMSLTVLSLDPVAMRSPIGVQAMQ